jgi:hypothetical protein
VGADTAALPSMHYPKLTGGRMPVLQLQPGCFTLAAAGPLGRLPAAVLGCQRKAVCVPAAAREMLVQDGHAVGAVFGCRISWMSG